MAETRKACEVCGKEGKVRSFERACSCWYGTPCENGESIRKHRKTAARTDQTAQGEAGKWEWECWTCTAAMYGDPEVNARFKVGPLAIDDHVAAGHDVRRVEGKASA